MQTAAYAERRKLVPRRGQATVPLAQVPSAEPTREDVAVGIIKEFEGLHELVGDSVHAYLDPVNIWTVGYGHTRTAKEGMAISIAEAENLLREDMASAMSAVAELEAQCPTPFSPYQAGALISFAFNIGNAGLLKSKSVAGRLRGGDYAAAADGLLKYVYAGGKRYRGLERRREEERRVFLMSAPRRPKVGIEAIDEEAPPPSVAPSAPAEKPLSQSTTVIAASAGAVTTATAAIEATTGLSGDAQKYVLIGLGAIIFATLIYIGLERWRKNRRGEEF